MAEPQTVVPPPKLLAMASPFRPSCTCGCAHQPSLNKGPWTPEEDRILSDYISTHSDHGNWRKLPTAAGLMRCGKSCRLRWRNYLRPDLKRGEFDEDEDNLIIQLHALLGNRWSLIAGRIPGRTDNEIKNYWNWHLAKKLGIDPKTHEPLRDTPPESMKKRSRKPKTCTEDSKSKPKNMHIVKRVKADYRSSSFSSLGSRDSSAMCISPYRSLSFSSIEHQLIHPEETETSVVSETISETICETISKRPACQFPSPGSAGSWSSEFEGGSISSSIMAPSSPSPEFLRTFTDSDGITEQIYSGFSSKFQDCWINSPPGADNMLNNNIYQNHQQNNQWNLDLLEDLDCSQFWEQCLHSISEQNNEPNWRSESVFHFPMVTDNQAAEVKPNHIDR